MTWVLLGSPLLGLVSVLVAARGRQRRSERDDLAVWVPPAERRRAVGVGHLGQAPTFPHHRMGRL